MAAPGFAVQVADRMVTFLASGQVKNDFANKMVQYCNQVLFSFTGLAELDGKPTDQWLSELIWQAAKRDLALVCQTIIERANRAALRSEVTA